MKRAISWEDVKKEIFTPEQIQNYDAKFEFIAAIVEARIKSRITRKDLENMSGVAQPVIARLEKGRTTPQLDTILKILGALGKTIKIVDIAEAKA